MSDIQRYDAWPQESPFEDKNGEFVMYEDHIKIVKELEVKLAMAVEALKVISQFNATKSRELNIMAICKMTARAHCTLAEIEGEKE